MIVVSNTSPLIALAKVDYLALLQEVFGHITIPEMVSHEVLNRGLIESYHAVEDALRKQSFYVPNY